MSIKQSNFNADCEKPIESSCGDCTQFGTTTNDKQNDNDLFSDVSRKGQTNGFIKYMQYHEIRTKYKIYTLCLCLFFLGLILPMTIIFEMISFGMSDRCISLYSNTTEARTTINVNNSTNNNHVDQNPERSSELSEFSSKKNEDMMQTVKNKCTTIDMIRGIFIITSVTVGISLVLLWAFYLITSYGNLLSLNKKVT
jgi:hypothetical protein